MIKNDTPTTIFFILLFAILCYFPLFMHLDHMSFRMWDEARRAVNAFEMVQNGNWLVTHYDGAPEMWGTKPPFMIWCQAICMKIFGFNELAVRLPAALAALGTVFLLIFYSFKILKRPLLGFLASLVLITTRGYISVHVSRSGDFDAILTLWETAYLFVFFWYLQAENDKQRKKRLYLMAFFVMLAGMTKGIAGFFFLPGILVYLIWKKEWKSVLTSKHTWIAAVGALSVILGFYFLREQFNPGYIKTVLNNEVGGRYLESKGGHDQPFYYYVQLFAQERFLPWLYFLPFGIVIGLFSKGKIKTFTQLLVCNALIFITIISIAKTKIIWYVAPIYPCLALLVAFGLERGFIEIWKWVKSFQPELLNKKSIPYYLFLSLFVIAIFGQPYRQTVERVYFPEHPGWEGRELKYRDFMRNVKDVKSYTIVHHRYNAHTTFYKKVFNLKGYQIESYPMIDFHNKHHHFGKKELAFEAGDILMICEKEVFQKLFKVYHCEELKSWDSCRMLRVLNRKY